MLFDPELVKEVFQGPNEQLNAGEANALLGPILGERSVLLLDGAEHLRHRRLMLPPFHGARMQAYAETMRDATDPEIDGVAGRRAVRAAPEHAGAHAASDRARGVRLRAGAGGAGVAAPPAGHIAPRRSRRGLLLMFPLGRLGRRDRRAQRSSRRRAVDEILFAEIARRRAPETRARDDVLSLLLAEDEQGERMTDEEIRDELVTLLVAGHETTATGLGWTFDLLLHTPERARALPPTADRRPISTRSSRSRCVRTVIPGVGRVVRGEPFRLSAYEVPAGDEINPSIRDHPPPRRPVPATAALRPERFLAPAARHLYLGAVRRRHSPLPRGELRAAWRCAP